MKKLMHLVGAIVLIMVPSLASAQAGTANSVAAPAGFAPMQAPCVQQADKSCVAVSAATPLPVTNVVQTAATDRGAIVGTSAVVLMAANAARRGFSVQVQSVSASCYISGSTAATADYHSLTIGPGGYFEPDHHVGTGAISIICTAASTPVYAREW